MTQKNLLVIKSRCTSTGTAITSEGLRMATAMIAMDVLPQILFIDDGAYCLFNDREPENRLATIDYDRLKTLGDLVELFVTQESLTQRALNPLDLPSDFKVKILSLEEAAALFMEHETVIAL